MLVDRSKRAHISLDGLSIGDAFGQQFFSPDVAASVSRIDLPPPPWRYTDDTEMALALVSVLNSCGAVDQDCLANRFAERFQRDPNRGYGEGTRQLLRDLAGGTSWQVASKGAFNGTGSFGNGAAMRVPPLGAWFAHDIEETKIQARLSADVTHAHHEARQGAVAVALAAGWAWRWRMGIESGDRTSMIPWIVGELEDSEVRDRLNRAAAHAMDAWAFDVAADVGCGDEISAVDTVPFSIWMAASRIDDFCDALWTTARVGGDIDTTCAIVGGIVAMSVGEGGIPQDWILHREPLN